MEEGKFLRLATPPVWIGEGDFGVVIDSPGDDDMIVDHAGETVLLVDPGPRPAPVQVDHGLQGRPLLAGRLLEGGAPAEEA